MKDVLELKICDENYLYWVEEEYRYFSNNWLQGDGKTYLSFPPHHILGI
jgi:hypothetical protein